MGCIFFLPLSPNTHLFHEQGWRNRELFFSPFVSLNCYSIWVFALFAAWFEIATMDFSRLHLYNPPQCLPENTGYTYALRWESWTIKILVVLCLVAFVVHFKNPGMKLPNSSRKAPGVPSVELKTAIGNLFFTYIFTADSREAEAMIRWLRLLLVTIKQEYDSHTQMPLFGLYMQEEGMHKQITTREWALYKTKIK